MILNTGTLITNLFSPSQRNLDAKNTRNKSTCRPKVRLIVKFLTKVVKGEALPEHYQIFSLFIFDK